MATQSSGLWAYHHGYSEYHIRTGDFDFQTRFITLPGERNKNRKPRLVPFSVHTSKLLLQLITVNREHFSTDRLFLSCFGDPISPNHFNKRLKYYGEKAGVEGKKMTVTFIVIRGRKI